MRTTLMIIFSVFMLFFTSAISVAEIKPSIIKIIHTKTQATFVEACKKNMVKASDTFCHCLADKFDGYIDDNLLSHCNDEACIKKIVGDAARKTLVNDTISKCNISVEPKISF